MGKMFLTVLISMLFISAAAFAEENQTDPCANVVCNIPPASECVGNALKVYSGTGTCSGGTCTYPPTQTSCGTNTQTCADGFVASCEKPCSNVQCGSCAPDCSAHQLENTSSQPICAQVITYAKDGAGNCKEFSNSCLPPGWTRVDSCPQTVLMNNTQQPICKNLWWFDDKNHVCNQNQFCGAYMYYGLRTFDIKEQCENELSKLLQACPSYTEPVCERGFAVSGGFDERGCPKSKTCCGNGICESNENQMNCKEDCIAGGPGGVECPISKTCPDGSAISCKPDPYGGCFCGQCPIQQLPSGCRQEKDEKGFVRVICEQPCPPTSDMEYAKEKCRNHNGTIVVQKDYRGCEYVDCRFEAMQVASPVSITNMVCPPEEGLRRTEEKCRGMGYDVMYVFEGGCKFVKCEERKERIECGLVPGPERERIEKECTGNGLGVIKDFDEHGCQVIKCGNIENCPKDPPKESFEKCNADNGELIVKRDDRGCVNYMNCIRRGDVRDIYVEKPNSIPETSELLSIAFKLENLKIGLDKLAKQADQIADYYKSVGDPEEGKYRRVADMFESIKAKVGEIKDKLRNKLESATIDDLMEVRQDIKYIKDVMIKDILYLMLSTGEDVKKIETKSGSDCGTDSACFDRAFRICQPISFIPGDARGTYVQIVGLQDDVCIMKVTLPIDKGPPAGTIPEANPPYEMTCKIKNYALGISNPQTDIVPYCEGSLMKLMEYDKQNPGSALLLGTASSTAPAIFTCEQLLTQQAIYFDQCKKSNYDKVCFDKYTGVFQGCSKINNNDCTERNMFATQHIWCDAVFTTATTSAASGGGSSASTKNG